MRFWNPNPAPVTDGCEKVKDSMTRQRPTRNNTGASRYIRGANGNISIGVFCKTNGSYAGILGTSVIVTLFKSGTRYVLQFFDRSGVQINGNVIANGGLVNLPAALEAKALLAPHFYVRLGDTTDQIQDPALGAAGGQFMTIK